MNLRVPLRFMTTVIVVSISVGLTLKPRADPQVSAFFNDVSGFDAAAGSPPIVIDFDDIAPGTDITGTSVAGVQFDVPGPAPGARLIVVRGTDTLTPSGFSGVIDAGTNKLFPTSGENVLSPGGTELAPGPNPQLENDGLRLTFDPPVSAVGFDILFQSLDCCAFVGITVLGPGGEVLYSNPAIPSGSGAGGDRGGAVFVGFVSPTENIAAIVIDESDGNNEFPDSNIGYDTIRFHPRAPRTAGLVLEPRLKAYGVPTPAERAGFTFRGWVNFPPSEGRVEIDVLKRGNGEDEADSWAIDVARVVINETPVVVDGEHRFFWSTGPIRIFEPADSTEARFPDGGTARVRFRAFFPDQPERNALLAVQDEDGVPTTDPFTHVLILADKNPSPVAPPQAAPGLPPHSTPDYLNKGATGSTTDTLNYYRSVGTDPDGRGPSIWKTLGTLRAFQRRYFQIPRHCQIPQVRLFGGVNAYYFNAGDLGLGRNMHCLRNGCTDETACYVHNYGKNSPLKPVFDDFDASRISVRFNTPFATVAMVERGRMANGALNKVFFAVYNQLPDPRTGRHPGDPPLALTAPLDNKALAGDPGGNAFIPGNCLVCHGSGRRSYVAPTRTQPPGAREAYFLPFDLRSFRFYGRIEDDDLVIEASRQAQEGAFRLLNALVFLTDLNADARSLIRGWYGGTGFPRQTFNDDFVPPGWDLDDDTRQLYRHVVAPTCRACHINQTSGDVTAPWPLRFSTFADFAGFKSTIYADVCRTHVMPNAEQTLKILWRGSVRPQLLIRLAIPFGCGWEAQSTRAATAASSSALLRSAEALYRAYRTESCACATRACLDTVEDRYLAPFGAMHQDASVDDAITALRSEAVQCRLQVLAAESSSPDEDVELEREQAFQVLRSRP